jgi:acetyl/propionyl-CoA carboxylase alpha subunit
MADQAIDGWACPTCTLMNKRSARRCTACGERCDIDISEKGSSIQKKPTPKKTPKKKVLLPTSDSEGRMEETSTEVKTPQTVLLLSCSKSNEKKLTSSVQKKQKQENKNEEIETKQSTSKRSLKLAKVSSTTATSSNEPEAAKETTGQAEHKILQPLNQTCVFVDVKIGESSMLPASKEISKHLGE